MNYFLREEQLNYSQFFLNGRAVQTILAYFVVLLPGLKVVPALYNWRVRFRIYRWYGKLVTLERGLLAQPSSEEKQELFQGLDEIESGVNKMKTPLAYANQFYVLCEHIRFVRERLLRSVHEV